MKQSRHPEASRDGKPSAKAKTAPRKRRQRYPLDLESVNRLFDEVFDEDQKKTSAESRDRKSSH